MIGANFTGGRSTTAYYKNFLENGLSHYLEHVTKTNTE
jgi:hypothetical protein